MNTDEEDSLILTEDTLPIRSVDGAKTLKKFIRVVCSLNEFFTYLHRMSIHNS